jgi:hypothetical protein
MTPSTKSTVASLVHSAAISILGIGLGYTSWTVQDLTRTTRMLCERTGEQHHRLLNLEHPHRGPGRDMGIMEFTGTPEEGKKVEAALQVGLPDPNIRPRFVVRNVQVDCHGLPLRHQDREGLPVVLGVLGTIATVSAVVAWEFNRRSKGRPEKNPYAEFDDPLYEGDAS